MTFALFPATVSPPAGKGRTVQEARLADYGDLGLVVWWMDPRRGVLPLVMTPPGSAEQVGQAVHLTDADGDVWTLVKGGGCGCSNPLKRRTPRYPADAAEAQGKAPRSAVRTTAAPAPDPPRTRRRIAGIPPSVAAPRRFRT